MIWEAIQRAKPKERGHHVIWLELASALGSVPHVDLTRTQDVVYVCQGQSMGCCGLVFHVSRCEVGGVFSKLYVKDWMELQVGIGMLCPS